MRDLSLSGAGPNYNSSDNGSWGGGSGSSQLPPSVTTGTVGSDTRSTSITLSEGLSQPFPTARRRKDVDGNIMPAPLEDEGDDDRNGFEEDDDRTLVSYQTGTGSSNWGSSLFGGSSVGGQSEVQREEMLGELRQLLDGEYHVSYYVCRMSCCLCRGALDKPDMRRAIYIYINI